MRVLTIIDSFKGTLSSKRLGNIAKEVLEKKGKFVDYISIADGGEGFLEAFEDIFQKEYQKHYIKVYDPLFREIDSYYITNNNVCYIELAKESGISLLSKDELNPYIASTYGFGQAIDRCINEGYKKIVVGIGGSATNDCGVGMLEALGVKFYDENNDLMFRVKNEDFRKIQYLDDSILQEKVKDVEIVVLSDVSNELLGPLGATYVFSKQKGAKEEDLELLEKNIKAFSTFKQQETHHPGSGAAGGVGYSLYAYLHAQFFSGIDYILDLIKFDDLIDNYDYIITGEGKVDYQSLLGKVVFRICERSKNKKVIVVCAINEIKDIDLSKYNIYKIESIVNQEVSMEESYNNPEKYFRKLIERLEF